MGGPLENNRLLENKSESALLAEAENNCPKQSIKLVNKQSTLLDSMATGVGKNI